MANRLKPYNPKRILDIGAGDGQGVAAVCQTLNPDLLLSIDENRQCLAAADRRLKQLGVASTLVPRLITNMESEDGYNLAIEGGKLPRGDGIFLVESDFLTDPELEGFLATVPPFDAITVWLIGTHQMRQYCLNLAHLQMCDNADYRLRVQNKAYKLADKILRPGGILQIVDRGDVPETRPWSDEGHQEQAAVTSLQVQPAESLLYKELERANRVSMVPSPDRSGHVPVALRLGVISVISVKPA